MPLQARVSTVGSFGDQNVLYQLNLPAGTYYKLVLPTQIIYLDEPLFLSAASQVAVQI